MTTADGPIANERDDDVILRPMLASGTASYATVERPVRRTELSEVGQPNYAMYILKFVEMAGARRTEISLDFPGQFPLQQAWGLGYASPWHERSRENSTPVFAVSLLHALFGERPKLHFVLQSTATATKSDDLNITYFTSTTLNGTFGSPSYLLDIAPAIRNIDANSERPARVIAGDLAEFLGLSLEELGGVVDIGRTTFSSWTKKEPRASTVRSLYRLSSLISALRETLGSDKTRIWLHVGEPSPMALLRAQDLSAVERLAGQVMFAQNEPPSSLAMSDVDVYDLPRAASTAGAMRRANRVIRGRATIDG